MDKPIKFDLSKPENHNEIAIQILSILQDIRFGSIEIVVHDGRVVQIDKHEKYRIKTGHNKQ
ncbi:YezD family protein [Methylomarinum sp. Ch1-1]|uniref:YezD family protein n=1 Tax=Methylomarinum roseum TaxID=3067653 RepID=A0AAU7NR23_9GAMM|nr:YezD family protein [Methylomarinum sp. Ch1-1]MDP4520650.1 YezD family protein [Methylomarinum sp. Ch1-1]